MVKRDSNSSWFCGTKMNYMTKALLIFWVSPNSLIGVVVGTVSLLFGGKVQLRRGCAEYYGGLVTGILNRVPPGAKTSAMTLGHTILGSSPQVLDRVRDHEQVHVMQYEKWGPLFLPAYLGSSMVLWVRGRDPYLDNPFEIEAYAVSDPRSKPPDVRLDQEDASDSELI